jgi:hypothetical protein
VDLVELALIQIPVIAEPVAVTELVTIHIDPPMVTMEGLVIVVPMEAMVVQQEAAELIVDLGDRVLDLTVMQQVAVAPGDQRLVDNLEISAILGDQVLLGV